MQEIFRTFGVNGELLIIQAVNFGLLLVALWYFLYKPLLRVIEERRRKIEEGVRDADAATAGRAEFEQHKGEMLTQATREAEGLVARGKSRAAEEEKRLMKEAEEKSERLLAESARRAEDERSVLLKGAEHEIARMAILAAEKLIREQKAS